MTKLLTWALLLRLLQVTVWPPAGGLPADYRIPNESDYKEGWANWRREFPVPYNAQADFNGDHRPDDAWILFSQKEPGFALFVSVGGTSTGPTWLRLETGTLAQALGLKILEPGRYTTACGKGAAPCGPGDPAVLQLDLPALEVVEFGSATWCYWWDRATGQFRKTWLSD